MMIPALTKHSTNEDLLEKPEVWKDVLDFCKQTRACAVALNLGRSHIEQNAFRVWHCLVSVKSNVTITNCLDML